MAEQNTPCIHDAAPIISAIDPDLGDVFPPGFTDLYDVYSYRNASRILATACRDEFAEIIQTLMAFRIKTEEIVQSGGNKSQIAKNMEDLLHPQGWNETRVRGDLYIRRLVSFNEGREIKAGKNRGTIKY